MPIYEYEREDGSRFEFRQSFSEEPLGADPETGQKVRRVLSAPTIMNHGTGLYSTAYRSRPKDEQESGGA
jgi:putative FmdB family regulatory protein